MSSGGGGGGGSDPPLDSTSVEYLGYRGIFWLVIGSLVIPIYLVACVLSVIKAINDRKAIKARIEARRLAQPLPPGPPTPIDIIAKEVRDNRWHKRQSSMTLSHVHHLLADHTNSCSEGDKRDGFDACDKRDGFDLCTNNGCDNNCDGFDRTNSCSEGDKCDGFDLCTNNGCDSTCDGFDRGKVGRRGGFDHLRNKGCDNNCDGFDRTNSCSEDDKRDVSDSLTNNGCDNSDGFDRRSNIGCDRRDGFDSRTNDGHDKRDNFDRRISSTCSGDDHHRDDGLCDIFGVGDVVRDWNGHGDGDRAKDVSGDVDDVGDDTGCGSEITEGIRGRLEITEIDHLMRRESQSNGGERAAVTGVTKTEQSE